MDFFEAQEFFSKMYPGKEITYEFDDSCHRIHEIVYTDGIPNLVHHIENRRVKVSVVGQEAFYVPISPHRQGCSWADIKRMINAKNDIHLTLDQIEQLKSLLPEEKENAIQQIATMADLDIEKIRKKVE